MNTEPVKKYIKALEAYENGKDEEAGQLLAEAVGLEEPTPIMKDSLKSLANKDDPNIAIVKLMMWEINKES